MQRTIRLVMLLLSTFMGSQAFAQERGPNTGFEQKTYVYEPWIKGKFSEVVTVKNPGKWIFLAGIGPESEGDGKIMFPGDFYRQCKYAYYRIKKLPALHGAMLKNVVFVTTYMVDIRHIGPPANAAPRNLARPVPNCRPARLLASMPSLGPTCCWRSPPQPLWTNEHCDRIAIRRARSFLFDSW